MRSQKIFLTNITLFTLVLIFFSCGKDNLTKTQPAYIPIPDKLESFTEIKGCTSKPFNGAVWIKTYATIANQSSPRISFSAGFWQDIEVAMVNKGKLKIGDIEIQPNAKNSYQKQEHGNLYGTNVGIKLGNENSYDIDKDFLLPKLIEISTPIDEFGHLDVSTSGGAITWNVDQTNTNGVAIIVTYYPSDYGNHQYHSQGYDKIVRNPTLVEDAGNFTLNASLFENIPNGAQTSIHLLRMNCEEVKSKDNLDNLIIGYTHVEAPMTYDDSLIQ